jgi:Fic family protein
VGRRELSVRLEPSIWIGIAAICLVAWKHRGVLFHLPELNAADERVLADLDGFREQFRRHLAEPRRWTGQLRRSLVAAAIRGSNAIEGYTISEDDAVALASGDDMSIDVPDDTQAAVEGYNRALTYVQQAAQFEVFHYDHMLMSAVHYMIVGHELATWPGRYRTGGIWVSGGPGNPPVYEGPEPETVPELMTELIGWLDEGDLDAPAYVRASMAHFNLVGIHPWRDGNGRMSRAVHTLVLARQKILAPEFSSIEEWLGRSQMNTMQYYTALQRIRSSWTPERDAHSWVRFCLRAHHLQAQEIERRIEESARLWTSLAEVAERHSLAERTVSALFAAASGHLRRAVYARDEDLTRDQSVRDLQLLKRLGLIDPVGHGRTQRYLGGPEVKQRAAEIRSVVYAQFLREPYPED